MAQQFQCVLLGEGGRVNHTPSGSDVDAGKVVVINGMFCFATQPIAAGVLGTLRTAGGPPLVRIVKVNGGISVGNAVYWDASGNPQGGTAGTGAATTTAAGNTFIGRAVAAAGANDETVDVELSIGVVTAGTLENVIADPGHAGAIGGATPSVSGRVALVSTGAQTRTLAAPTKAGLQLLLYMKTDGGDITLTCATTFNEAGNNTAVFGDTGDALYLISVEEGSNYRWRLATVDGVALSTV